MPVPAIVLAAGASRRLGQPKQLLRIHEETLLDRSIRLAREAGASVVFPVLGAYFAEICASIRTRDAALVCNDEWEEGISSSIRAGLHALRSLCQDATGALIMTCDQPRLTADHLRSLLRSFQEHKGSKIVASNYAGAYGVPAVFPPGAYPALERLRGDKGARALLADPRRSIVSIDFPGGEMDIDQPSDLSLLS